MHPREVHKSVVLVLNIAGPRRLLVKIIGNLVVVGASRGDQPQLIGRVRIEDEGNERAPARLPVMNDVSDGRLKA